MTYPQSMRDEAVRLHAEGLSVREIAARLGSPSRIECEFKAVSEHMFAQLLCLMKKLHLYRDSQHEGAWTDEGPVSSLVGGHGARARHG